MTEKLGNNILPSFSPITLDEMEHVSLMDRTENKYVMSVHRLPGILTEANGNYRILEIDNSRIFSYYNTYYDTESLLFYNQHLTGKLARHKVRFRKYEQSGITYLEVKRRTNRNRTKKWRLEYPLPDDFRISSGALDFINDHVREQQLRLSPVLINRFKRMTLIGKNSEERITIDFDVTFADLGSREAKLPYLSIVEIKRKDHSTDSALGRILKKNMIQPSGFSKYCIGNAMVNHPQRLNNLKSRFLLLNKIQNEYINAGSLS
jgi:hypothetical protein